MDKLGSEIRREFSRLGPQAELGAILERWEPAVGELIARNAWPARIARDGTLHVATADSVWAFELGQQAARIAEAIGIEKVTFAPGPLPDRSVAPALEYAPPPSPELVEEARALTVSIEDDELRESVQRAVLSSLRKGV
jgi:hypothetical protein